MARRSVPAYCLHKGSGQAFVKLDGERLYLGVHGSPESQRRYAKALAAWQAQADESPQRVTVAQLTLYLERCAVHYRK